MTDREIKKEFLNYMRANRGGSPASVPTSVAGVTRGKAIAALRPAPDMPAPPQQAQAAPQLPAGAPAAGPMAPSALPLPAGPQMGSQGMGAGGGLNAGLARLAQLRGAREALMGAPAPGGAPAQGQVLPGKPVPGQRRGPGGY